MLLSTRAARAGLPLARASMSAIWALEPASRARVASSASNQARVVRVVTTLATTATIATPITKGSVSRAMLRSGPMRLTLKDGSPIP